MNLDETIRYYVDKAEEQSKLYSLCSLSCNGMKDCLCLEHGKGKGCVRLADNYKQLAEWLKELKRWKENPFEVIDDSYCSKIDDCVECDFINCCPNRGVQ